MPASDSLENNYFNVYLMNKQNVMCCTWWILNLIKIALLPFLPRNTVGFHKFCWYGRHWRSFRIICAHIHHLIITWRISTPNICKRIIIIIILFAKYVNAKSNVYAAYSSLYAIIHLQKNELVLLLQKLPILLSMSLLFIFYSVWKEFT